MFQMLKTPVVLARTGRCKTKIHMMVHAGTFTPQIRIGERAVARPDYEVDAQVAAQIAGWTDDELRQLVIKLVEFRKIVPTKTASEIEVGVIQLMASIRDDAEEAA